VSAVKEQIKVLVGDQVTMRFLLSGLAECTNVRFMIEPLDNSTDVYIQVPCSNNNELNVLVESSIVVESSFLCARVSLTLTDVKQESFGRYNLRVVCDENEVIASTDLIQAKTVSKLSVYFLVFFHSVSNTFTCSLRRKWLKIWST